MDSSKLYQLLVLEERLANSPALKAAEQAARQFHESPGMQAAALAAERVANSLANSPALKAAEQAARQFHESRECRRQPWPPSGSRTPWRTPRR